MATSQNFKNGGSGVLSGDVNLLPPLPSYASSLLGRSPQLSMSNIGFQIMNPSGVQEKNMPLKLGEDGIEARRPSGSRNGHTKLCARGHWRPAEDSRLKELVAQYGPQNWNLIAEHLEGRSGNQPTILSFFEFIKKLFF